MNILQLHSSARTQDSVSAALSRHLVDGLRARDPAATVTYRHVDASLPLLDEALMAAVSTDPTERTPEQAERAALPDTLIEELEAADAIVLAVPIYNFSVPAALKAWIDLVARARRTFRYTENGPVGLLRNVPVHLLITSGGVPVDSAADFATPYLRQVLGFLGLKDVRVIAADRLMAEGDGRIEQARAEIDDIVLEFGSARVAS
ncbi:MAG: NAD(P)H-dependent oxidoreductase [Myxococcota bacterium]